ncbi:uncharacterized protein TNCV_5024861 [Trichonephila clavipes]|nr:uncharacterized protein TNCV_5024861 [Trichonephila clavipes]
MIKSYTTFFRHPHKHSNDPVSCPEYLEPMTLGHFYYKHAPKTHTLDSRKQCICCFGRQQWNRGGKNLSVNVNQHIVSCLKLFVTNEKDFSAIVEEKEEDIAEKIEVETCECQHFQSNPRDMAGRRKLNIVGFYDSMFEKPEMWEEGIEFHGGLGKDVWGIVERYLRGDLEWFHIGVKHDIFEIFCREMEKIGDQCVILPFWCLCDGLVNEKGKIQHRHMILACKPESSLENIWKEKIRYEFPNIGRAKRCIKIKHIFHLVRTMMYVSQPKSSCDKDDIPDTLMNLKQWSHFHINRPLHPHNIASLGSLFLGVIEKLLWEQVGNKNFTSWEKMKRRTSVEWGNFK